MELLPVLTTYLLVFVYCTLFLGHIKSLATGLVGMRLTLSLCGVLLVVLAVSSSLGLLSYLGLPANLLVLRVMPLLVLAVGLDNLFFLVHSYEMVGISQGFSSHFVWQFLFCSLPTRHLRAVSVLTDTGGLVVGGIAMTKLLAVFALIFASPLIFGVYYFRMYMSSLLWANLHGLVLLPVLLSYIGPTPHPVILNSKTSKEKCVSQKKEEAFKRDATQRPF